MMNKHSKILTTVLLCSCLIYSCDWFKKTLQETQQNGQQTASTTLQSDEEDSEEIIFSSDTGALKKAEDALRNRPELRGKAIFIYESIHFYDDHRIYLKIRNPDNPQYVDEYHYKKGAWDDPEPVVISKDENIAERCIELDQVPFTNAYHVYRALQEKRAEIGSKSNDYTPYLVIFEHTVRWYPTTISNERSAYDLTYNEDGTLKSFEQK